MFCSSKSAATPVWWKMRIKWSSFQLDNSLVLIASSPHCTPVSRVEMVLVRQIKFSELLISSVTRKNDFLTSIEWKTHSAIYSISIPFHSPWSKKLLLSFSKNRTTKLRTMRTQYRMPSTLFVGTGHTSVCVRASAQLHTELNWI